MNKRILIVIVAAVIVTASWLIVSLLSAENESNDDAILETAQDFEDAANALNLNTDALMGAYQFTVVSEGTSGGQTSAVFKIDEKGNVSAVVVTDGQEAGYRFVDQVTYIQNPDDGTWLAYPAGSNFAPSLAPGDLALSDEDINEIATNPSLEDLGVQDCIAGTCRVYRDVNDSETAIVKIDQATNRLVEIEVTDNETSTKTTIKYSYDTKIEIIAPEDVILLSDPQPAPEN